MHFDLYNDAGDFMLRSWEKMNPILRAVICSVHGIVQLVILIWEMCLQSTCSFPNNGFSDSFMTMCRSGCTTSTWGPGDLNLSLHISCHKFSNGHDLKLTSSWFSPSHMLQGFVSHQSDWEDGNCKGCFWDHVQDHHPMTKNSYKINGVIWFRLIRPTPHATE